MSLGRVHPTGGRSRQGSARLAALAALLLLAACGPGETDPGPGGVTAGEARALDEAAEMLEEQRLKSEDLPEPVESPSPSPGG